MTMSTIVHVLLTTLSCVYLVNAQRQNCDAATFSCRFNNPCDPECVPGQQFYPGAGPRKYVECVEGQCIERRCSWRYGRTEWNQDAGACLSRNGEEPRCATENFNCGHRNPCSPSLCEAGVLNYQGPSGNKYVECSEGGACAIGECPVRLCWDQDQQRCVRT